MVFPDQVVVPQRLTRYGRGACIRPRGPHFHQAADVATKALDTIYQPRGGGDIKGSQWILLLNECPGNTWILDRRELAND